MVPSTLKPARARGLLVVVSGLWGLTFVGELRAAADAGPPELVALRFVMVSVVFGAMLIARPELRPRLTRRDWGIVALSGFLVVPVAQVALAQGQRFLAPALSGVVVATAPAITLALSMIVLGERVRRRQLAGFALAFSGALVVIVLGSGTGAELVARNPWGAALVVLAQVGWAAYTVVSKPFSAKQQPVTAVATILLVGTVMVLPFLPGALRASAELSPVQWLWMIELVIGSTVVPYLLHFAALRVLDANAAGAYLNLVPVFGFLWAGLLLGQRPSAIALGGAALVIVGVLLTQSGTRAGQMVAPLPKELV